MPLYFPTQKSLSSHPLPSWFQDAHLGVLIRWGLFSPPGDVHGIPSLPTRDWDPFIRKFDIAVKKWDPTEWAELFHNAGAKYVLMPAKQPDGFLLWPSAHPNPTFPDLHSKLDLVGKFFAAAHKQDLQTGLYYSGGVDLAFYASLKGTPAEIARSLVANPKYAAYVESHWRELVERFSPAVLWNDLGCPASVNLSPFFADYYNQLPLGVINDRFAGGRFSTPGASLDDWSASSPQSHFDFHTPGYDSGMKLQPHKWETRINLATSRTNDPESSISFSELLQAFIDIVSKNGNLLLTISPTQDGRIPPAQRDLLLSMGKWLNEYGESIFDALPCFKAEGKTSEGLPLRFTRKDRFMYIFVMGLTLEHEIVLMDSYFPQNATVEMLGYKGKLGWERQGHKHVRVQLPPKRYPSPAHVFKVDLGIALPDDPRVVIADLKANYRPPRTILDLFRRKKHPLQEPPEK